MNTIVGLVRPRAGSIVLDGRELAGASAHEIARAGIAIVPQGRRIFSRADGRGEPEARRGAAPAARCEWSARATSTSCCRGCGSGGATTATSSPAASSRWSRSAARCSPTRASSSSTSRPRGCAPLIVDRMTETIAGLARARAVRRSLVEQNLHVAVALADRVGDHGEGRDRLSRDDGGVPRQPRHGTGPARRGLVRVAGRGAPAARVFVARDLGVRHGADDRRAPRFCSCGSTVGFCVPPSGSPQTASTSVPIGISGSTVAQRQRRASRCAL